MVVAPSRGNMEVAAGPWSEIFEGDGGTEANSGGDVMLGSSTLTLTPLVAESPSVRRSQPIFISSNRWAVFLSPDCVARLQCECVLVRPCLTLSNGWDLSLHLDFCPFLCSWLNTGVFFFTVYRVHVVTSDVLFTFRARADSLSSSVPSIPNPFPELCSPSKSPVLINSLPQPPANKHVSDTDAVSLFSRPAVETTRA